MKAFITFAFLFAILTCIQIPVVNRSLQNYYGMGLPSLGNEILNPYTSNYGYGRTGMNGFGMMNPYAMGGMGMMNPMMMGMMGGIMNPMMMGMMGGMGGMGMMNPMMMNMMNPMMMGGMGMMNPMMMGMMGMMGGMGSMGGMGGLGGMGGIGTMNPMMSGMMGGLSPQNNFVNGYLAQKTDPILGMGYKNQNNPGILSP